MNVQTLLIENTNRPEIQAKIKDAFEKGAKDAGFSLWIRADHTVAAGTLETYENFNAAVEAGLQRVRETVNLD